VYDKRLIEMQFFSRTQNNTMEKKQRPPYPCRKINTQSWPLFNFVKACLETNWRAFGYHDFSNASVTTSTMHGT